MSQENSGCEFSIIGLRGPLHDPQQDNRIASRVTVMSQPTQPRTVRHRTQSKSPRRHGTPPVMVHFDCENDAARRTLVAMTRCATLDDIETRAHTLYASSTPEKLRGARVRLTVNGYALQGPLTVGEIHDAVAPDCKDALHVYCSRVLTLGRHTDF